MLGVFLAIGFLAESKLEGFVLLAFIPYFAIQIKRSRDIGWSGWLSLLSVVPIAQFIWLIVLGVKNSKKEENSFYSERAEESQQEYQGSNFKQEKQKKENDGFQNGVNERIIRCPSCKKKIRVRLPLQGKKGKCVACLSSFSISMDEHGNLKVDKETDDTESKASQGRSTIAGYFKVLGIEPSATPDEVRAAYKRKIREYHPDKVWGLGEKLKQVADAESKAINAAYTALKSKGLAN